MHLAQNPGPSAQAVTERMAHAIADLLRAGGCEVSSTDLHARGFTPDQVSVYGPAAKARAAVIVTTLGVE